MRVEQMARRARLLELAHADVSVLLGRPTSAHEQRIVGHLADLFHTLMCNVEDERDMLRVRLAECERRDAESGDGPTMAVVA